MKTIKMLNEELMKPYKNGTVEFSRKDTVDFVNLLYSACRLPLPRVVIAKGMEEYKDLRTQLERGRTAFTSAQENYQGSTYMFEPDVRAMLDKYIEFVNKTQDAIEPNNPSVLPFINGLLNKAMMNSSELYSEKEWKEIEKEIDANHRFFKENIGDNVDRALGTPDEELVLHACMRTMSLRLLDTYTLMKGLKTEEPEADKFFSVLYNIANKAHIHNMYTTKEVAIVLWMPKKVYLNNAGELHNPLGPAIEFLDGEGIYRLNGRDLDKRIVEGIKNDTLTFEHFVKEKNEDIKASIITVIKESKGNSALMKFLNAVLVDEKTVVHEGGYIETLKLYKSKDIYPFLSDKDGKMNQPYAWLWLKCPSTSQEYLIDMCPSFTDAIEAAKWLRPEAVSMDIPYFWFSAN